MIRGFQQTRDIVGHRTSRRPRAAVCHAAAKIEAEPPRLAIFVSGGGSNMRNIYQACQSGAIKASVEFVVTDNPKCGAVDFALDNRIPVGIHPVLPKYDEPGSDLGRLTHEEYLRTSSELNTALTDLHACDFALLAGYLRKVPHSTVSLFNKAMLNIHPALLPSFGGRGMYGQRVHKAVIKSGVRHSGATVHFVDDGFDTGPILAQATVPCYPMDTPEQLAARVLKAEHELYPAAVAALCDGRVEWRKDGVPYMWRAL